MTNIVKSVSIYGAEFTNFFLNDNLEPAFKYSTIFPNSYHEFVFDIKRDTIIVKTYDGKLICELVLKEGFPENVVKQIQDSASEIKKDIVKYGKRLESDIESVIAFETQTEEVPFIFTTQTYLDHGEYSPKYQKAIVFHINNMRVALSKEPFKDFQELTLSLGKLLKNNSNKLEKKLMGRDEYYEVELNYLASL